MKTFIFLRLILLPLGLILKIWNLAVEGSRDFHNRIRFKNAIIDSGCCINEKSEISSNTHLLDNCIINNSKIESFTYIGKNCIVQNTTIGKYCSIANDVLIGLGRHPIDSFSTSPLFYRINNPINVKLVDNNSDFLEYLPITIGNDVWIGARAILLDGVNIGNGAIIASNSVVTKDVPPYAIVGGVPAKKIKYRFSEEKINKLLKYEWWKLDNDVLAKDMNVINNM